MFRISKLTDYGIVLLAQLADEPARTHNARELAEHTGLPLPAVSKVLKLLGQEGLVTSHRGAKGGYELARPPRQIDVAEIIEALEGPIALMECSAGPGHCEQEASCLVREPWQRIQQAIRHTLEQVSLADLIRPGVDPLVQVVGLEALGAPQREAGPGAS